MALFNLIPFGILDGYKIFSINKKIWVPAFIPALPTSILVIGYSFIQIKKHAFGFFSANNPPLRNSLSKLKVG